MFFCWASLPSELQIFYRYNVRPGWPDRSHNHATQSRKSQATQKWCVESKGKDIRDFSQVSFIATLHHYQKNFCCLQQLPFWLHNPSLILQGSLSGTYPWMSPATIWSRFQSSCWQIFSHEWLAQTMSIVLDQEETQRNRKFETRLVTGVLVGWAFQKNGSCCGCWPDELENWTKGISESAAKMVADVLKSTLPETNIDIAPKNGLPTIHFQGLC